MFVIPLIAAVVGAAFAMVVGRQYMARRKPYQAVWALALAMFGVAAAFETVGQLAGWSDATYKGYYLFGGLLNVGWLGIGSLLLMVPPRVGRVAVMVMVLISLICVVAVLLAHTDAALLKAQVPVRGAIDSPFVLPLITNVGGSGRRRRVVGVEIGPRRRPEEPSARPGGPGRRSIHRRRRAQLRAVEGRVRRAASQRGGWYRRDVRRLPRRRGAPRARLLETEDRMIIDIAIVLVLVVALFLGYQRGVIQPLMAEIFFFGTLLLVFRFHDQYTNEMSKLLHLNAVLSVFVALILAVIMGAIGGAVGGAFHRLEALRGIDGLLGIFVHVVVTLVVIYLAVSALVTLDNAFEPTLKSANLTLSQVNDLENLILSNPITAAMVSKQDLDALRNAAKKSNGASIESVGGIHQLQQIYVDFLQPQLHSSRAVPIILAIGSHIPIIGHVGPGDLKPLPKVTPSPSPTPKVSPTPTPHK